MNIVIVDDDMALLRSLEVVFTEKGHHVMSFCDPKTALLYIGSNAQVDAFILDYKMPGMSGEDLLRSVGPKLRREGCKIIMISGHGEEIRSYKILEGLGVRCVLNKPPDLDQICEMIA